MRVFMNRTAETIGKTHMGFVIGTSRTEQNTFIETAHLREVFLNFQGPVQEQSTAETVDHI